ncbi:required for excision 1-B domain-containing protein [Tamandua tetradactyla]|uniref:required for excision 1-B domain-containing protein n=1 Tax=Tamandua tetradactyla TaxID=48850 RepID=UPI0040541F14
MITAEAAAAPRTAGYEGAAWPWKDAPLWALVLRVHELQAERARAFRRLDEGHRQYLGSGPPSAFPRYRATVHEVTQAFAAASREVLALEAELAGPRAQPLLAGHLRRLQCLEQTHLATVALLQLTGTPEVAKAQEDAPRPHELKLQVIKTMEAISDVLQDLKFDAESAE